MEPDQICSEQSRSGDGANPGGGWILSNATALSSGLAEKCAAELTGVIWVGSGVPCWAEATWAVAFAGIVAQHFTGSRCCDLGHEVLQHEAALKECACAHKIPPIDKTTSTDSSTMAERLIIKRILFEVLTTSNHDRHWFPALSPRATSRQCIVQQHIAKMMNSSETNCVDFSQN